MKNAKSTFLYILSGLIFLATLYLYLKRGEALRTALVGSTYWILTLLVALSAFYFKQIFSGMRLNKSRAILSLSGALLVSSMLWISVPPRLRTLSDETNLIASSKSMFEEKKINNSTIGKVYYGNYHPVLNELDKRPFLYPYLIHVFHVIRGYDYKNAFVANIFLATLFFFFIFYRFSQKSNWSDAVSIVLLTLSLPIFSLCATSAGFEFFTWVGLFFWFWVLRDFLAAPSSEKFTALFLATMLYSHVRYESFIIWLPMMFGLLVLKKLKWSYLQDNYLLLALTPLFAFPLYAQRIVMADAMQNPDGVAPFAFGHIITNGGKALRTLLDFNFYYPYNPVLFWLSLGACLVGGWQLYKRKSTISRVSKESTIIAFMVGTTLFTIYAMHFMGWMDHPSSARFFLLFLAPLAFVIPILQRKLLGQYSLAVLVFSGLCFGLYHPVAMNNVFYNTLTLNRKVEIELDFLQSQNKKELMILDDRPGQMTVLGYGAMDFNYANQNGSALVNEINSHLFGETFVFQEIQYSTNTATPDTDLRIPPLTLETLVERQLTGDTFLRISRVTRAPTL